MTCIARAVSQSAGDKVIQLMPCMVLFIWSEKTMSYALHIKYRKLNLIGCDSVDKEAQTDFCRPRSAYLFASFYRELMLAREHYYSACLYTRVLFVCSKYLNMQFTTYV